MNNRTLTTFARGLVSRGTTRSSSRNVTTIYPSSHQQQLTHHRRIGRRCFSTTNDSNDDNDNDNDNDDFLYNNNNNDDNRDRDHDVSSGQRRRPKTALVVGSSGSLGRCVIKHLSRDLNVRVIGADVVPPQRKDEYHLTGGFVELPTTKIGVATATSTFPETETETTTSYESEPSSLSDLTMALTDGLHQLLEDGQELDAVICVAGAWEGDPTPSSSSSLNNSAAAEDEDDNDYRSRQLAEGARDYAENIERMMGKNLYPVLAAGYASQQYMTTGRNSSGSNTQDDNDYGDDDGDDDSDDDGGLFVAIGATAALSGTPGMMGYGLSKVATHHFLQTLGETSGKAVTSKSKRKLTRQLRSSSSSNSVNNTSSYSYLNRLSVVGILPTTIDTPANREAMPDADFSQWTKSIDIAKEIGLWMRQPALRPHSGSLVKVHPKKSNSSSGGGGDGGAEFKVAR